jgi:protein arginine kinase activator
MKCEICEKRDATVYFKQVVNGDARELHVCAECAAKNGFDMQSPIALTDFLFGAGEPAAAATGDAESRCPGCGLALRALRKSSRAGCDRCYESFADEMAGMLEAMQGADKHTGKTPSRARQASELEGVRKALAQAVRKEDFEEAARLRDLLCRLGDDKDGARAPRREHAR